MRVILSFPLLLFTAACAAVPAPQQSAPAPQPRVQQPVPPTRPAPPPMAGPRAPQIQRLPGLEQVIEHDTASLVRRFGNPRLDVREDDMRKLQFADEACVLDVYLYPLREGTEPVATHVEARRASDGREVDRASCVRALER
jgi:hypothetical protein